MVMILTLTLGAAAHGQDDPVAPPANPEADAASGFPWLCFATAVGALGGLYVLVRRREQALEADGRPGRGPGTNWYCRACDRDVSGPACPDCGAPNPFLDIPSVPDPGRRRKRSRAVD
jgi:hypothetical protein